MLSTIRNIVAQMNANGDTFSFEMGKKGYLNLLADEQQFPAVLLNFDSTLGLDPKESGFIGEDGDIVLLFLYKSELEWTPTQQDENCISPSLEAVRQFISLCQDADDIDEITVNGKGNILINLLDECASGLQFSFTIKLNVNKSVCAGNTPSQLCQPSSYIVKYEDDTLIEQGTILSGNSTTIVVPNCNETPTEIDITFDSIPLGTATTSPYNIDCTTPIQIVIVSDSIFPALDGTYVYSGIYQTVNEYTHDTLPNTFIRMVSNEWRVFNTINAIYQNDPSTYEYPYQAGWDECTLVQGTIEDYCSNPCADATYSIKDSAATVLYSGSIASGGNLNQTITDSTVENSDASYTDTVLAEGTLVLPDTTYNIYVNGVLNITFDVPTLKNETINISV